MIVVHGQIGAELRTCQEHKRSNGHSLDRHQAALRKPAFFQILITRDSRLDMARVTGFLNSLCRGRAVDGGARRPNGKLACRPRKGGFLRVKSLDSLRGLAALVVVFHHMALVSDVRPKWISHTPLRLLFAGESAVMVFFVLSGLVLQLTFAKTDKFQPVPFWIKRLLRIYPPFAVAVTISFALYLLFGHGAIPEYGIYFSEQSWLRSFGWPLLGAHLLMTDRQQWQSLDAPMWSLVVEIRLSLFFPLLAICMSRSWKLALFLSVIISVAAVIKYGSHDVPSPIDLIHNLRYLALFAAGAALAENLQSIRSFIDRQSRVVLLSLWAFSLVLVTVSPEHGLGLPTGVAAVALIVLCFAHAPADRALSTAIPLWLGRISYSLYLIHVPIMLMMIHLLHTSLPVWIVMLVAGALSLPAAELLHRLVEMPSMALGRRLAGKERTEVRVG